MLSVLYGQIFNFRDSLFPPSWASSGHRGLPSLCADVTGVEYRCDQERVAWETTREKTFCQGQYSQLWISRCIRHTNTHVKPRSSTKEMRWSSPWLYSHNSKLFCFFHEWNLLWKFGRDYPLDGVVVKNFVSHSFSCFNDLKRNTPTNFATTMGYHSLWFFISFEKKKHFSIQEGHRAFDFWVEIPSQKSEIMNPLTLS